MTVARSSYTSSQRAGHAPNGSKLPPPPPPPLSTQTAAHTTTSVPAVPQGKVSSNYSSAEMNVPNPKSRPPPYSAASSMSSTPSSLSIAGAGNAFSAPGAGSISFPEISHDERQRIRRYWFSLDDAARRSLVMLEKEAILAKLKETRATRNCQCPCCGRSKAVIEEELDCLYEAYLEEIEQERLRSKLPQKGYDTTIAQGQVQANKANGQARQTNHAPHTIAPGAAVASSKKQKGKKNRQQQAQAEVKPPVEEPIEGQTQEEVLMRSIDDAMVMHDNNALRVNDALLRENGSRFLDILEDMANRAMMANLFDENDPYYHTSSVAARTSKSSAPAFNGIYGQNAAVANKDQSYNALPELEERTDDENEDVLDEEDLYESDEEYEEDSEGGECSTASTASEAKLQEGRRMFQFFAAKMLEQRLAQAWRETVARERQTTLLQELEAEEKAKEQAELRKSQKKEAKKLKQKQEKQRREEEERDRKAKEAAALEAQQAQQRAEAEAKEQKKAAEREAARQRELQKQKERDAEKALREKQRRQKQEEEQRKKEKEKEALREKEKEKERLAQLAKQKKPTPAKSVGKEVRPATNLLSLATPPIPVSASSSAGNSRPPSFALRPPTKVAPPPAQPEPKRPTVAAAASPSSAAMAAALSFEAKPFTPSSHTPRPAPPKPLQRPAANEPLFMPPPPPTAPARGFMANDLAATSSIWPTLHGGYPALAEVEGVPPNDAKHAGYFGRGLEPGPIFGQPQRGFYDPSFDPAYPMYMSAPTGFAKEEGEAALTDALLSQLAILAWKELEKTKDYPPMCLDYYFVDDLIRKMQSALPSFLPGASADRLSHAAALHFLQRQAKAPSSSWRLKDYPTVAGEHGRTTKLVVQYQMDNVYKPHFGGVVSPSTPESTAPIETSASETSFAGSRLMTGNAKESEGLLRSFPTPAASSQPSNVAQVGFSGPAFPSVIADLDASSDLPVHGLRSIWGSASTAPSTAASSLSHLPSTLNVAADPIVESTQASLTPIGAVGSSLALPASPKPSLSSNVLAGTPAAAMLPNGPSSADPVVLGLMSPQKRKDETKSQGFMLQGSFW